MEEVIVMTSSVVLLTNNLFFNKVPFAFGGH